MNSVTTTDFTTGSIPKKLVRFALPLMASNVLQVMYSVVDMLVVGNFLGANGVSAISIGSVFLNMLTMLCVGFCNGGQVVLSQLIGANKKEEINNTIGSLFSSVLIAGTVISVLVLAFHSCILDIMKTPEEAYSMAKGYMIICGIGIVFTYGYNMVSAVFRGMGDSKRPFIFVAIATVMNLILDMLFVGVFKWGVPGAAAATIIGQAVSFFFALVYLYRRKESFGFDFRLSSWRPQKKIISALCNVGIPLAIQSGLVNLSMIYVNRIVNALGVAASAAFGIGVKLDDICIKVSMALTYAANPIIAQNIAAHKEDRAVKTVYWTWAFAFALHMVFLAAYSINATGLFSLFVGDNAQEVLELAPVFVDAIKWTFPAMALMRGSSAFIQGIGNGRLSMILGLIDSFLLRIGLSTLFGIVMGMGFYGFVLGYGLAPLGSAIPGTIYFFSGVWKKKETVADQI